MSLTAWPILAHDFSLMPKVADHDAPAMEFYLVSKSNSADVSCDTPVSYVEGVKTSLTYFFLAVIIGVVFIISIPILILSLLAVPLLFMAALFI